MKLRLAAATALVLSGMMPAGAQSSYPFVGRWNCEVATFTFTDKTYNNGSETLRMTKVTRKGGNYELSFPKNYKVIVGDFRGGTMTWLSGESGDTFTCKKLK